MDTPVIVALDYPSAEPALALDDPELSIAQVLQSGRLAPGVGSLCALEAQIRICSDGVEVPEGRVRHLPRVGIDYAGEAVDWPLRFRVEPD